MRVCFTPEGRALIRRWAEREGVSFSEAVEALARAGLRQDSRAAGAGAPAAEVADAVRADLAHYRALLASIALDAGVGRRLAAAAARTLRPRDYPRLRRLARLEAIETLRLRGALAELDRPDDPPTADEAPEEESAEGAPFGERAEAQRLPLSLKGSGVGG
jgi:hypothetical protein